MAQLNDVTIYKGEATLLQFTMTPVQNIAGWTIVLTVKLHQTDTTSVLSIPATVTDPTNGVFTVSLSHSNTNIRATTYYYDVQRTDSGSEAVLSIGAFTVTQEVLY